MKNWLKSAFSNGFVGPQIPSLFRSDKKETPAYMGPGSLFYGNKGSFKLFGLLQGSPSKLAYLLWKTGNPVTGNLGYK
ncbi:MAG: hypothetical protein CM1200mP27_00500 [Chloroflexota bacterium]|nr:MAG: hypothetical protein CM1200mP27_00500 [Chloroflexota bacterium]